MHKQNTNTNISEECSVEVWNILIKMLIEFIDNHIPRITRNVNKELPWFTNGIKNLIKKRNNLFKRYKKTSLYYFRSKYNAMRNLVTKRIRSAKSRYESKMIEDVKIIKKSILFLHCN